MISHKIFLICKDYTKIENYDKAVKDTKVWDLHHRLETHFSDGSERPVNARLSAQELKTLNMYYDRPSEELIFLTRAEHNSLHFKGYRHSEKVRRKMSESNARYWKGKNLPEKVRRKMSEARKKCWQNEEYRRRWSESRKDFRQTEEARRRISESLKKYHWYTNGVVNIRALECPEGFKPGRLRTW